MALPYLDHVIKETLRFVPAVHSTVRVAAKDDVIPTSDGTRVFIRKGQGVHVAIEGFNRLTTVWGPDGHEFKPERWANLPRAAKEGPGLVQGLMTFSLGPHVSTATILPRLRGVLIRGSFSLALVPSSRCWR